MATPPSLCPFLMSLCGELCPETIGKQSEKNNPVKFHAGYIGELNDAVVKNE
jgi:hypothetical protein